MITKKCRRCGNEHYHSEKQGLSTDCFTTLRDRFAMAALTGMMSGTTSSSANRDVAADRHAYARHAYAVADAMMEFREKP